MWKWQTLLWTALLSTDVITAQPVSPKFRVVALAEAGGIHKPFVDAAKIWLEQEAGAGQFPFTPLKTPRQSTVSFFPAISFSFNVQFAN